MVDTPEPEEPLNCEGKSAEELKPAVLAAIAVHIQSVGCRKWSLLRERPEFSHIIGAASGASGERRFWRWRETVVGELGEDATRPHDGRDANESHKAWAEEQAQEATDVLPAVPPAAFFVKQGADGFATIDLFAAATQMWDDLGLSRAALIEITPGGLKAKCAKALGANVVYRATVMERIVGLLEQVYGLKNLHARYKTIVGFLMEDLAGYPELQRRLLDRLKRCNVDAPHRHQSR